MKAFLKQVIEGDPVESVKLLDHALEVLDWAREKWATIAREHRGAVLELSWRRSVCCMKLRHLVQVGGVLVDVLTRDGDDLRFARRQSRTLVVDKASLLLKG